MKIAIITLQAINNYGSVLQTLATEELFRQQGCDVVTINYKRESASLDNGWRILTARNLSFKLKLKTLVFHYFFSNTKRELVMGEFRKKYLHLTTTAYNSDIELELNPPDADIYCTGSDQTWNTVCQGGIPKPFFLHFVPRGKHKISYAASFGVSLLPQKDSEEVKKLLAQYDAISVRETSGLEILKKMGINGQCVLDPTLTLDSQYWSSLAAPRMFKEEYLLAYQLNRNTNYTKYMISYAKKHGLKIVQVRSRKDTVLNNGICLTAPTPQEWLSLIKNAKCVLTDSFHATAFCTLFHKNFMIIPPNLYSSRINDFLAFVGLTDRVIIDYNDYSYCDIDINFSHADRVLNNARKESLAFINNAIKL
jgi:hypothetical protein